MKIINVLVRTTRGRLRPIKWSREHKTISHKKYPKFFRKAGIFSPKDWLSLKKGLHFYAWGSLMLPIDYVVISYIHTE